MKAFNAFISEGDQVELSPGWLLSETGIYFYKYKNHFMK